MCKIDQKIKCADTPLQEYQVRFNKSVIVEKNLKFNLGPLSDSQIDNYFDLGW